MYFPAFFGRPEDWLIVLLVAVLLFGSSRIPELARSLGRSVNEFKKGMREGDEPAQKSESAANTADSQVKKT
jgi:sec-independent protein translocase protein TatA